MLLLIFLLILYIGSEPQTPLIYFSFFFYIIEGKKLEELVFFGLVHMRFLWFSSLSDILKLRCPLQPDKICWIRHLLFTSFQFANHKNSFNSSLNLLVLQDHGRKMPPDKSAGLLQLSARQLRSYVQFCCQFFCFKHCCCKLSAPPVSMFVLGTMQ